MKEQKQRVAEWYRARLGHITGSEVHNIMGTPRSKGEVFTETAKSYLYKVLAERLLRRDIVESDKQLMAFIDLVGAHGKALERGQQLEADARSQFEIEYNANNSGEFIWVEETGSVAHPKRPYFAASPDGLIEDTGVLEIKSPYPSTFARYASEIESAETLKKVKPEYYWQVMAEMCCTEREWCAFVAYCPEVEHGLHIAYIERDEEAIAKMLERVDMAEAWLQTLQEKLAE